MTVDGILLDSRMEIAPSDDNTSAPTDVCTDFFAHGITVTLLCSDQQTYNNKTKSDKCDNITKI